MRILLVTPPMVQTNAPYPATACLASSLARGGHDVVQVDASLALALKLFSRQGILDIAARVRRRKRLPRIARFIRNAARYADTIEPVMRFLQGSLPSLRRRILSRRYLPEGPRFMHFDAGMSASDPEPLAIHLASLYLDDLVDIIREGLDDRFELSRYAEKLAVSAPSFDPLARALEGRASYLDGIMSGLARSMVQSYHPQLVGFTIPFPGNLYGALRMARAIKTRWRGIPIVFGGGYVNTELRSLSEPRLFDYADFVCLDDGREPLNRIIGCLDRKRPESELVRTFVRREGIVRFISSPHSEKPSAPLPDYASLPRGLYFPMMESLNPMQRVWSCERWNKMMLAHGCYWHRCVFCDTSLDYIRRYAASPLDELVTHIRTVIRTTGHRGFHFTDEAMPPALLRRLSRLVAPN